MRKYACVLMLLSLLCIAVRGVEAQTRPRRVGQTASQPAAPYTPAPRTNNSSDAPAPATTQARHQPVLGGANRPANQPGATQAPAPAQNDAEEVGEGDVVRVNTTLVTIPVSVSDRNGKYVPDLRKEDFRIFEDGAEQQVAYFASVEKPFTVVLMIDTSGSTRFQLEEIQDAAIAFVNQLRADDRVIVVSFDDQVRVLAEATNDRYTLRDAIRQTRPGDGTRLYDAVDMVINQQLSRVSGRKAIVLFTDGVDTTSRHATYESTVRAAEELDALVYPVQYDTYDGSQGGGGQPWPGSSRMPPLRLPSIFDIIIGGTVRNGGGGGRGGRGGGGGGMGGSRDEYMRASAYLREMSEKTGARLYHADSVQNLEHSFALVAEELRRQYSLGYYPRMTAQAGQRRQIKVRVTRPELAVRARDSYVVGSQPSATAQDTQPAPVLRKTRLVAVPEKPSVPPGR
jgi:Ca-activated chloride channel family protein